MTLTLFYTRGLGPVVLHVMVPQPDSFLFLLFDIGNGNLTILEFSPNCKCNAAYTSWVVLSFDGVWGKFDVQNISHSAGCVTTQIFDGS
jgi:hypothetical protein